MICGDELIFPNECEDGNFDSGDGCSSDCQIESGYNCTSDFPSICQTTCLDGIKAGIEECDDGN